ncbi:MAG: type II secretion system F family protein [Candidatus Micrarchaeota archaeon]|nr:type II secretion system F family protein [Candidatus Micrarchaeota archaeon]
MAAGKKPNIFEKYYQVWERLLIYNDIEMSSKVFNAYVLLAALAVSFLAFLVSGAKETFSLILAFVGFVATYIVAYTYLVIGANSRAVKVEEVLPDFLSLMASNIRAGLTPDKALIVSAREEFGPLTQAVNRAGKRSITGMPLEEVIMSISERVNSQVLEKTTRLIVEGLRSGGELAELLDKSAMDLRRFRAVRREINSVILSYVLFIIAAITFGAPMLYGVSSFLVDIMLFLKKKVALASAGSSTGQFSASISIFKGQLMLTPEAVSLFASAAILITVFFGCMAVGVMYSGRRTDGIKYFPLLGLLALGILFGIRSILGSLIGAMLGATT